MQGSPRASKPATPIREPVVRVSPTPIEFSPEIKAILRPWIDVDELGSPGFLSWLQSILPLIPRSRPAQRAVSNDSSQRIQELAAALAECAQDRARVHFQAAEYYRENQALARRMKALEAALRTQPPGREERARVTEDSEAERASRRYLPGGRA